ncbi:peroxidasin homolog [Oculina patagonica]
MQATSFLLGVLLTVGWYDALHALSSDASSSSAQQVLDTLNLPNCDPLKLRLACLKRKFRTFDGTCNNLCNITRGAVGQPHVRFEGLGPAYEQPGDKPRLFSTDIGQLPNARKVSFKVFRNLNRTADFTHLVMTWGQFLDHDLTLTELTPLGEGVSCGTNTGPCLDVNDNPDCISIPIQPANELRGNPAATCIPFSRSLRDENGEQLNELTAYIDASQVYGSDLETADSLRNLDANLGLLSVEPFINSGGQPILPRAEEEEFCRSADPENKPCFRAGDIRVNENQALMAIHALFVREHNRIASYLHVLNPMWDNERLFQEARRIVGALMQHITYNEWLEVLFSETLRKNAGVMLEPDGQFFEGYDPAARPEMFNVFSTAALRMGHTLIRDDFAIDNGTRPVRDLPRVALDFFKPEFLFDDSFNINPYGGIFLGLVLDRALQFDQNLADVVRENLVIEGNIFADLAALNIQRGRDHGLPGYIQFSTACGGPAASGTNFDALTNIQSFQRYRLSSTYRTVEDIDVFAGMLSENLQEGSQLGQTTTCVILRQLSNSRAADRFWYERNDPCTGFTLAQLTEIRKHTLARMICDNTDDVDRIQPRVFSRRTGGGGGNEFMDCNSLPFLDLNVFKEESGPAYEGGAGEKAGGWSASVGA